MNNVKRAAFLVFFLMPLLSDAQDFYSAAQRSGWLSKAELNKPRLSEQEKRPVGLVKLQADTAAFQGWKTIPLGKIETLYANSFKPSRAWWSTLVNT
jgi:hypothetical protein